MLRRVTNILMTCLLLVSTTGVAVSKHYCGDRLVSVELKAQPQPCCDNGMCCHTETSFYKLDNNFLATAQINFGSLHSVDIFLPSAYVAVPQTKSRQTTSFIFSGPPPCCTGTRLAMQQVYRL